MSKTTRHGENIASQCAYGDQGELTIADIWNILDNLQTSVLDNEPDSPLLPMLSRWLHELEDLDEDLPL